MNMMEIMESIFGKYTLIEGATNWQYIGGVAIFCIIVWSIFTIVGTLLKR